MHVLATAGHVDHGKSTLVQRLTDMDPDRWAEEKRRGLTLDLGFAWTTLPSGARVAFVDVPGHERFVANMLAGVGPVGAVVFVVAADEGWMPQSAEHLAAVDAFGVRHGLLVVTRSDLADPALAAEEAQLELAGTSLGDVETVCVSGHTGQGLDELRAALDRLVAALPVPDPAAPARLWVDRSFTVSGSGTVVTGTLAAGSVRVGDELTHTPGEATVRVRGLQSLKSQVDEAQAVARLAVNLRGVSKDQIRRGHALLSPGRWLTTTVVDVRLFGVVAAELPRQVLVHVGTAGVAARVRPLGPDTARLRVDTPLPLRVGDRAVVREPGSRRVFGLVVLDVRPPSLRMRGAAAARQRVLAGMDGTLDGADELRRRGLVRASELRAMGAEPPVAPLAGDWLVSTDEVTRLTARLADEVSAHVTRNPLEPGLPIEAARRLLGLPDPRLVEALAAEAPALRLDGGRVVSTASDAGALPAAVEAAVTELHEDLAGSPYAAPDAARLSELGLGPRELAAAVRTGLLLRVADGVYLRPGADQAAAQLLAELPQPFTTSEARKALNTSRRVAIPLLESLDASGLTRRLPDDRRQVRER